MVLWIVLVMLVLAALLAFRRYYARRITREFSIVSPRTDPGLRRARLLQQLDLFTAGEILSYNFNRKGRKHAEKECESVEVR